MAIAASTMYTVERRENGRWGVMTHGPGHAGGTSLREARRKVKLLNKPLPPSLARLTAPSTICPECDAGDPTSIIQTCDCATS